MAGFQIRDQISEYCPPWLQNDSRATPDNPTGGVAGRYMYCLGLACDVLLEKAAQAAKSHIPTKCPPTALPLLGNDRVMVQGPSEPNPNFATRLQQAFPSWQRAGQRRAVMQQIAAYITGFTSSPVASLPMIASVGGGAARAWSWFAFDDDTMQPPETYNTPSGEWHWDGLESSLFWRSWLVIFAHPTPSKTIPGGAAANVTSASGQFFTVTGLANIPTTITSPTLPGYLTLSGASSTGNNGTFQITQYLSATSVVVANPEGVASDANNGAITWSVSAFEGLQPLPVWDFPGAVWPDDGVYANTNQAIGVQVPGAPNSANTAGYFATMRSIIAKWSSGASWYVNIVLNFTVSSSWAEFSPWLTGSGNPSGNTWGLPGTPVAGAVVQSRLTSAQFGPFNEFCDATQAYGSVPCTFES